MSAVVDGQDRWASAFTRCDLRVERTLSVREPVKLRAAYEVIRESRDNPLVDLGRTDRVDVAMRKLLKKGPAALAPFDHMVLAYNLAQPHELAKGKSLLDVPRIISALIQHWRSYLDKAAGLFIWRGSLLSLFRATHQGGGFAELRAFLAETLHRFQGRKHRPNWLDAVLKQPELLGMEATQRYAGQWIEGDRTALVDLQRDVEIPAGSWFWSDLVRAIATQCCEPEDDSVFDARAKVAIGLLTEYPGHRDIILAPLLNRYVTKATTPRWEALLGASLDAWGSPQLGFDANRHKWSNVSPQAAAMVCGWLAEEDLQDFQEFCKGDPAVDGRRLAYWLRFKKQITFSKIVVGAAVWTASDQRSLEFIRRKRDRIGRLTNAPHNNALILRIGEWWFVEFSQSGNACYPYLAGTCKLDFTKSSYVVSDLRSQAMVDECGAVRLIHLSTWETRFDQFLAMRGIGPDSGGSNRSRRTSTPRPDAVVPRAPDPEKIAQRQRGNPLMIAPLIKALKLPDDARIQLEAISIDVIDGRAAGGRLWLEVHGDASGYLQQVMRSLDFRYVTGRGFYWSSP